MTAKGEESGDCNKFAKYYRSLCPGEWVSSYAISCIKGLNTYFSLYELIFSALTLPSAYAPTSLQFETPIYDVVSTGYICLRVV